MTNQAMRILKNTLHSVACLDLSKPTKMTAPTKQCVVLIGIPRFDAINTVQTLPNSMINPLKKKFRIIRTLERFSALPKSGASKKKNVQQGCNSTGASAHKLLDTFLFMKILPEQDTRMTELYSFHFEISIDQKILLPKRSIAIEMAQKIPVLLRFCTRL